MDYDPASPSAVVALNADVVGYSRLMADDFEMTSGAMRRLREIVASQTEAADGSLLNFVGDNFMAIFDDSKVALQTAIAITREVEEMNGGLPESRRAQFRMGLDKGPVVPVGDDYQGEVLNVAARIQAIAPQGGVSVSARVYRALDEPALRFRPAAPHQLKNIPESVRVYEFVGLPSGGAPVPPTSLSLETPTVAVLPIHTESADESAFGAAAIVRGDLVHRLASVSDLRVIDANNVAGAGVPEGAARYMLETGVFRAGSAVRVYATLFDVTTMNVVKSHKWTTSIADLAALSEEIADEVARSLEVDLVVGAPAGLYADLNDPVAIQKAYRGWYHLRSDTREGWARAVELFEEVAESHPDQPYGFVLAAFALWAGTSSGWVEDQEAGFRRARDMSQRGLAVGDPTGMAESVEAAVLMSMGQVDEAIEIMGGVEIKRPTCDVTYGLEGSMRRYLGQWEEAVDLLDVAMRLTGINKPWYPTVKASSLFIGRRLESAGAVAETVLEFQPNNLEALLVLAAAQLELGLERRAHATVDHVRERFASVDVADWLERSPFQDPAIIDRWRADFSKLGLIPAS